MGTNEVWILKYLGDTYWNANILDRAEEYYREALKLAPNNQLSMNSLASLLIENDINIDEGLEIINKAVELSPNNFNYMYTKGWGLYKIGKYEESLELLESSWDIRSRYNHNHYVHIQEVKQALAKQNSEQ